MSENNRAPRKYGAREVLGIPAFRTLWIGQTISQVGDGLTGLAVLIVVTQLTGSTAALAGMTIAISLPQLFFGLLAGVFVDRWDRRRTMIVSDLVRGVLVLGLILVQDPSQLWILYVLGFLQAAVGTFFNPAKGALVPLLVGREALLPANALSQSTQVIAGVTGTALAGVMVGATGNGGLAFTLDALSFLISALFIMRIAVPQQPGRPAASGTRGVMRELTEGLRFILGQRILVAVILVFVVTMLGVGSLNVLFVPYMTRDLHLATEWFGIVEAAQVIGMVLGSGLVAMLAARLSARRIIALGIAGMGVMVGLIGSAQEPVLLWLATFGLGLCLTPMQASAATILQQRVPNEKRGRANSAVNTVIMLANVIAMATAGALGDVTGIRPVFYLSAVITVLAGALAALLLAERAPAATAVAPSTGE